jgi:hypothetical protein
MRHVAGWAHNGPEKGNSVETSKRMLEKAGAYRGLLGKRHRPSGQSGRRQS